MVLENEYLYSVECGVAVGTEFQFPFPFLSVKEGNKLIVYVVCV